MQVSGKLVIIGVVTIALAGAAGSWWFRYSATRRAAKFWDSNTVRLIRDAPIVEFFRLDPPPDSTFLSSEFSGTYAVVDPNDVRDVGRARGLLHLRNALLEDRSFNWPSEPPPSDTRWEWVLEFRDKNQRDGAMLLFSGDCTRIAMFDRRDETISSAPIAGGLRELFAEWSSQRRAESARTGR